MFHKLLIKDVRKILASFYTEWKDELGTEFEPDELEWYAKHLGH